MQGVELVNRLLLGEPETTIGIKYESTLDGRNAANHERSHARRQRRPAQDRPKGSPDAAPRRDPHPGQHARTPPRPPRRSLPLRGNPGHTDVGDKADEPHTSEEELGVTTPKPVAILL